MLMPRTFPFERFKGHDSGTTERAVLIAIIWLCDKPESSLIKE